MSFKNKAIIVVFFLLFGIIKSFYWQNIFDTGHLIYDSAIRYKPVATNGISMIENRELTKYAASRIFPAIMFNVMSKYMGIEASEKNIVLFYKCFNLLVFLAALILVLKLADGLKNNSSRLFFIILMLANFSILNIYFYYNVLTDQLAFLEGLLLLYSYLNGKTVLLTLTMIVGAFTWPTAAVTGLILIAFKNPPLPYRITKPGLLLSFLSFILLVLLALSLNTYNYLHIQDPCLSFLPSKKLLFANVICAGIGLYYLLFRYIYPARPFEILKKIDWKKAMLALAIFISMELVKNHISFPGTSPFSFDMLVYNISRGIKYPFFYLINHILYFGIGAVLLVFVWNGFIIKCFELGAGFYLVILANVAFCMSSESRFLTAVFPFFIYAVALVLQKQDFSRVVVGILSVIQLVLSRVWMLFNANPGSVEWNSYLSNNGPWMVESTARFYYVFAFSIFILTACAYYYGRAGSNRPAQK